MSEAKIDHRAISKEFDSVYGGYLKRPAGVADTRIPGRLQNAYCFPDGCTGVNVSLARVMIEAHRKNQRGGFVILRHEEGHFEEGVPIEIADTAVLKLKYLPDWHLSLHNEKENLEIRDLSNERRANSYAVTKTDTPEEDIPSAIAIVIRSMFPADKFPDAKWKSFWIEWNAGLDTMVENLSVEFLKYWDLAPRVGEDALKNMPKMCVAKFKEL